jgi:hypothetical protein
MSVVALPAVGPAKPAVHMAPSPETIAQAKADFMTFVQSDDFETLTGPLADFATALKIIYTNAGDDPQQAFDDATETLFSEVFRQAKEKGHLINAAKIFADKGLDQVAFVDDLAKQMIALAEKVEAEDGVFLEVSAKETEAAKTDLMTFIESEDFEGAAGCTLDAFKAQLLEIARFAKGDELTAFVVDRPDQPGYCHLFTDLIRKAEKDYFLSDVVSRVFFAPKFDQIGFIRHFVNALKG